jgi:TPR repeat protein/GTPase SAR1 family protein
MNAKNLNILLRNNTGNKEKAALIEGFVVRTRPFENIFKEISSVGSLKPEQNYLVIGQRGSGKTTILYRLKYAIEDDAILTRKIVTVMLAEEQYNLLDLETLWEHIGEQLGELAIFRGISNEMVGLSTGSNYEEKAFETIEKYLKTENMRLIVFMENIDVFFKKISLEGQQRLREVLISSSYIRLIASSTSYFESIMNYDMPFYNFFKITELKGLTRQECIDLLIKIGEQFGEEESIEAIINNNPNRIESLRRLTGGVPRTISYLFQIFLDNVNGKAIKDLYQLIDTMTFLYKAELDQLSAQQQKLIDVIARNWDAIAVKDIVAKTKFESKNVSSLLNVLEKNQFIEKIPTDGKLYLYRIRERFLNIWYLMRFGKKQEKENVVWLVRFYDAWCDGTELARHISRHLENLTGGNYDPLAALDMGNMFLECENVSSDLKYDLYIKTKSILPRKAIGELRVSNKLLYDKINSLVKKKSYDEAIEVLNEIAEKGEKYYDMAYWIYSRTGRYNLAEENQEKCFELTGKGRAAFKIAYLNEVNLKNDEKAIQYYLLALEKKEFEAAERLGNLYFKNRNLHEAKKYHQLAVSHEIYRSYLGLSFLHMFENDFTAAEKYAFLAIDHGVDGHSILAQIYMMKNQFAKAETVLNKSLKNGYKYALLGLAQLFLKRKKKNYEIAKQYFQQAIEAGFDEGYYSLGKLEINKFSEEKGIELLKEAIKKGNESAAHYLAHYYQRKKVFEKAEEYFLLSATLGRKSAILCLVHSLFQDRQKNKKQHALNIIEQHLDELKEYSPSGELTYAIMLLWNGQIEKSIELVKQQLPKIRDEINKMEDDDDTYAISDLVQYMVLLLAKGQYNAAIVLFSDTSVVDLKQVVKPVYFALMYFMQNEYPKEYLKAGDELKETIAEIIEQVIKIKEEYI